MTEIREVKVGCDSIVLGNAKVASVLDVSRKEIYMALAKDVLIASGGAVLQQNASKTRCDINSAFLANKIEVLGPPSTSGIRDAFVEMALEDGCKKIDWIKPMKTADKQKYKATCHTVR